MAQPEDRDCVCVVLLALCFWRLFESREPPSSTEDSSRVCYGNRDVKAPYVGSVSLEGRSRGGFMN